MWQNQLDIYEDAESINTTYVELIRKSNMYNAHTPSHADVVYTDVVSS
jgi:hypothetical protein